MGVVKVVYNVTKVFFFVEHYVRREGVIVLNHGKI